MSPALPYHAFPYRQNARTQGKGRSPSFGKLQMAGIILWVVFVWCIISAVFIAMFEIHILALTEYQDDGKSDVYGYVTDENGEMLENVTVSIHGTHHFAKTNRDGFFSMENVREGKYDIEASSMGYGSITKSVSLSAKSPAMVNFMLEEGGYDSTVNERNESHLSELRYLNYSTAIVIVIFGSLALLGGIFAFFERFYWFAMFGALSGCIGGALSIGIIIGPVLSIVALALILLNHEEFTAPGGTQADSPFGIRKKEPQIKVAQRAAPMKPGPYPAKAKTAPKKLRPAYMEAGFSPPPSPQVHDRGPMPPPVRGGPVETGEPALRCAACSGTIRAETHGVVCRCGAWYHRFCAASTRTCRRCGNPL